MRISSPPFGLKYPLFQAPTGSIAGSELCSAVTFAGGMGAMALTWTDSETAITQIRRVLSRTSNPFQGNFALAFPPLALQSSLDAGLPFVTFSWGDPAKYLSSVRASGAKFGIQVTTREGARRMLQHQPDFLICQGVEAGGHVQATQPLSSVLEGVVEEAGDVPVIASGGIGEEAGIVRVLRSGAAAAMLGTRFVATQESLAHEDYKRLLTESTAEETALTVCFNGGWEYAAHRVLRNSTLANWEASGCSPVGSRPGEGELVGETASGDTIFRYEDTAPRRGFVGNIEEMCLYAGTSVGYIRDIPSVADLIPLLMREWEADRVA